MADHAAQIAEWLVNGEVCAPGTSPAGWTAEILTRLPDATIDEIERGFAIALEMQIADSMAGDV